MRISMFVVGHRLAVQIKNIAKRVGKTVPNEVLKKTIVDLGELFKVMRFSN